MVSYLRLEPPGQKTEMKNTQNENGIHPQCFIDLKYLILRKNSGRVSNEKTDGAKMQREREGCDLSKWHTPN